MVERSSAPVSTATISLDDTFVDHKHIMEYLEGLSVIPVGMDKNESFRNLFIFDLRCQALRAGMDWDVKNNTLTLAFPLEPAIRETLSHGYAQGVTAVHPLLYKLSQILNGIDVSNIVSSFEVD